MGRFRDDEIPVALEVFDAALGLAPTPTASLAPISTPVWSAGSVGGRLPAPSGPTISTGWRSNPPFRATELERPSSKRWSIVLRAGARLIIIETAGRPDYTDTRAFYAARGYSPVATIPDFYAPGDDQVVFVKAVRR